MYNIDYWAPTNIKKNVISNYLFTKKKNRNFDVIRIFFWQILYFAAFLQWKT